MDSSRRPDCVCINSTIELASAPAFTAQRGTWGQLLGNLSWNWTWEIGGLLWGGGDRKPGLGLGPGRGRGPTVSGTSGIRAL